MRFKFSGEDLEIVHEVLSVEVKTYVNVYYVVDKTTKHANDMHFVWEIYGRYYNHISSKKRIAFKDIFAFKNGIDEEWDKINLNCFDLVPILGGDVVD